MSCYAFSQSYRGMFDLSAGIIESGKNNFSYSNIPIEVKPFMGGIFSMSHGCQITPFLFAGLGTGINLGYTELSVGSNTSNRKELYAVTVPVFLDVRWDLDIRKKITPFVDLKIGYQFKVGEDDSCYRRFESQNSEGQYPNYDYDNTTYTYACTYGSSSFYFQPTVGVRFKGGKRTGFNLGISYNTKIKRVLYVEKNYENYHVGSTNDGVLMLNIGLDY